MSSKKQVKKSKKVNKKIAKIKKGGMYDKAFEKHCDAADDFTKGDLKAG